MEPRETSRSVDDRPTDIDHLNFKPYVKALAAIIGSSETKTPLTVGVFGAWGSGKTSLMQMVRKQLPEDYPTVWFDAWKYEREDALWRALIIQVLNQLREEVENEEGDDPKAEAELNDLEASLYRVVDREEKGEAHIDWGEFVGGAAKGLGKMVLHMALSTVPVVGANLSKLAEKAEGEIAGDDLSSIFDAIQLERQRIYREHVQSLEQFQQRFEELVDAHIVQPEKRLIVFIDDLDRCLPEKAVEVLEAIKLFMDVPGCLFVLGLDRQVIARGIEIRYKEMRLMRNHEADAARFAIEGRRYLEKIIQIPFKLPPVDQGVMKGYVGSLITAWPDDRCQDVFSVSTGESPRRIKRMVNTFLLLWEIAKARELADITPVRLAKVVALQHVAPPGLYEELESVPRLLRDLEAYFRKAGRYADQARWEVPSVGEEEEKRQPVSDLPPVLQPYVQRAGAALGRLLTMHTLEEPDANFVEMENERVVGLPLDLLARYFTLAQQAEAPDLDVGNDTGSLPIPQTVPVPEGAFLMGTNEEQAQAAKKMGAGDWITDEQPQHSVYLSAYEVGKYPVTNNEYQAFVEDADYTPPEHWKEGVYPEGKGGHPVVNISWEDATAYCEWLTEKTGKPYALPTEAQWEKAARGTNAQVFPWGDAWDPEKLNSAEKGPGNTTPVGTYSPAGDSPYGAADMAGNVWEWCRDGFEAVIYKQREKQEVRDPFFATDNSPLRVVRGGSFDFFDDVVRCAFRNGNNPNLRYYDFGFRVVVLPLSSDL